MFDLKINLNIYKVNTNLLTITTFLIYSNMLFFKAMK